MSDSEYDTEYDSDYSDESSVGSGDTDVTEATCTSLEAALADMTARLAQLDQALDTTAATTQTLEKPVTTVVISAFTNPRVLESAPFRATQFRVKPAAKELLNLRHHTVTFAELCAAIRQVLRGGTVLGASDFLGVLQCIPDIIE